MKKHVGAHVFSLILITLSALIHFGAIDKSGFMYQQAYLMPVVVFVLLLSIIILESKLPHTFWFYIKAGMFLAIIVGLLILYAMEVKTIIPSLKDSWGFFYGEGWRIIIFTILFFIPLFFYAAISFAYFAPILLLVMALITNIVVFIKQLKNRNSVNLNNNIPR